MVVFFIKRGFIIFTYKIICKIKYYITKLLSYIKNEYHKIYFKKCGTDVKFTGNFVITGHSNIEISNNVHIGNNAFIRGEGGLFIGENTRISRNLVLYTINHNYEGEYLPYDLSNIKKKVSIGKNVWIGMNVIILPGSTVGDGAIIGAGTVVTGKVPALAIIGSQKWKILKNRNEKHYHEVLEKSL